MKQLIIKLIDILKENTSTLDEIKTYKKGVLPPLPIFPAISILPNSESFSYVYSGGKYRVAKEVEIQIYVKGMDLRVMRKNLRLIMDKIIRILTDNYTLDGYIYDLYLESQDFQDPLVLTNSIIQLGSITAIGYLLNTKLDDRPVDSRLKVIDENKLVEKLKDLFIEHKKHEDYPLENIKSLHLHTMRPEMIFPAVLISGTLDSGRSRTYTGLDSREISCNFYTFTKLMDKNYALYTNLDLVENIVRILQLAGNLDGYVLNGEVTKIDYYRSIDRRMGLVYQSIIEYTGQGLETLTNTF